MCQVFKKFHLPVYAYDKVILTFVAFDFLEKDSL